MKRSGPLRDPSWAKTLVAALAAVSLLGLVSAPVSVAEEHEERVGMSAVTGFSPARLEIETGTTVVWENENHFDYPVAGGTHEVVADDGSFASPAIAPGASWGYRFLEPGTYAYHDARDDRLTGEVVVTGEPVRPEVPEEDVDIVEPDPNDTPSWGFEPADLVVTAGTKITWRNTGGQVHTVTASDESFDSGDVAPGETWERTFSEPGAFQYFCEPHPWMEATVRVAAEDGEPPPPPPPPPSANEGSSGSDVTFDTSPPPASSGPQTHRVAVIEGNLSDPDTWTYRPQTVSAKTGDTLEWRNTGSLEHTVTADDGSFDSGDMETDDAFTRTFDEPGTYRYSCTPHPWMTGAVVVSDRPDEVDVEDPEVLGGSLDAPQAAGPPPDPGGGDAAPFDPQPSGSSMPLPLVVAVEFLLLALAAAWIVWASDGRAVERA